MNESAYIKNLKALASMAPSPDDAKLAASSLEEFRKRRAKKASRTRIFAFAASFSSIAAAIAVGIILIGKNPVPQTELVSLSQLAEARTQEIIVTNSITTTEYNTRAGEVRTITLEDGTKIWMNALTTIRVPNHFQEELRKIELVEGEAYFDVAHNEKAPFIVSTYDMEIKVLGTEFNVFAYKGYETKASLLRGSIKAYSSENEKDGKIIKPNESIALTNDGLLKKESLTEKDHEDISWKEGKYIFDNQPLNEITQKLQLYYGTKFTFADEEKAQHQYSGKFRQGDDLDWILSALQKADRFEYTYNSQTNTIIIN